MRCTQVESQDQPELSSMTEQHTRGYCLWRHHATLAPFPISCPKVAGNRKANYPQHLLKGSFITAKDSWQRWKSSRNSLFRKDKSFSHQVSLSSRWPLRRSLFNKPHLTLTLNPIISTDEGVFFLFRCRQTLTWLFVRGCSQSHAVCRLQLPAMPEVKPDPSQTCGFPSADRSALWSCWCFCVLTST